MNNEDMMREMIDAKKNAEKKAGMVKISDVGYIESNDKEPTPIHKYDNLEKCECKCHPNKIDCMNCYDHPTHLKNLKS
jgi:hypothetical protein